MDNANVLKKLTRVAAPPDFERRVMAQLARRRAELPRARRAQVFRYSLAGAAAALLVCFLALNVFVLRSGPDRPMMAGRDMLESAPTGGVISITEPVSYRNEVRGVSYEPQTVYILEQVSNASNKYFRY
jgi:hypothetical protein